MPNHNRRGRTCHAGEAASGWKSGSSRRPAIVAPARARGATLGGDARAAAIAADARPAASTRWHGTMMATGLLPHASPTARGAEPSRTRARHRSASRRRGCAASPARPEAGAATRRARAAGRTVQPAGEICRELPPRLAQQRGLVAARRRAPVQLRDMAVGLAEGIGPTGLCRVRLVDPQVHGALNPSMARDAAKQCVRPSTSTIERPGHRRTLRRVSKRCSA